MSGSSSDTRFLKVTAQDGAEYWINLGHLAFLAKNASGWFLALSSHPNQPIAIGEDEASKVLVFIDRKLVD
jgi:hypothetical protein